MKSFIFIIFTLVCLPLIVNANNNDLAVSIASNRIDVTVGFNGSSIEVFGNRLDQSSDIAIVVEGPKKNVVIWQKARVLGTWVNRHYAKFNDFPVYYHYAISRNNEDDLFKNAMKDNAIGHDGIFHQADSDDLKKIKNLDTFKKALLQKNYNLGVFFKKPAKIKFISDNFFRVSFKVPPSAPTGEYKIRSFLIKNGDVIESTTNVLKVEQVGVNAFIVSSARDYSLIYALVSIFFALFSGWLVSVLRVKP